MFFLSCQHCCLDKNNIFASLPPFTADIQEMFDNVKYWSAQYLKIAQIGLVSIKIKILQPAR